MNVIKNITESIINGADVNSSISGMKQVSEAISKDLRDKIKGIFENDESIMSLFEDEEIEDIDDFIDFIDSQCSSNDVWAAYFPDFCQEPYWYKKITDRVLVMGSPTGDYEYKWNDLDDISSIISDYHNRDGGGDFSEVNPYSINYSIDDLEKLGKTLLNNGFRDAVKEDDNWCIYKGSLSVWLGGECCDNIPDIGMNPEGTVNFKWHINMDGYSQPSKIKDFVKACEELEETDYNDDVFEALNKDGSIALSNDWDESDFEPIIAFISKLNKAQIKFELNV